MLLWTLVIANSVIGLSYFSIPVALASFIRRQQDLQFRAIFLLFGAFILACGTTHFISVLSIWYPVYRLDAAILSVTAGVSVATALLMWPLLPKIHAFLAQNKSDRIQLVEVNSRLTDSIDELRLQRAELVKSENRFRLIIRNAPIGMAVVALDGRFSSVNQALCSMLGYSESELLQLTFQDITHADDLQADLDHVQRLVEGKTDAYRMEKRYIGKAGNVIPIQLDASVFRDESRKPIHFVAQIQDITERRQREEKIWHVAHHDFLTELPNRQLLYDRLAMAMERARRGKFSVAILVLDLDHFKQINDTLGHHAGDELLQRVAKRLVGCVRAQDTVARMGGDEFVVVLSNISSRRDAELVAKKIVGSVSAPIAVGSHELTVTPSIGISFFPEDGPQVDLLLARADSAMYQVKSDGRSGYAMFNSDRECKRLRSSIVQLHSTINR